MLLADMMVIVVSGPPCVGKTAVAESLAREFGVQADHVRNIVEGRLWKHLDNDLSKRETLSARQAADYVGTHLEAIRQDILKGELPAVREKNSYAIRRADVEKWNSRPKRRKYKRRAAKKAA